MLRAVVRHFFLNLIRAMPGENGPRKELKLDTWDTDHLLAAITLNPR
jgi:hypothetical protein